VSKLKLLGVIFALALGFATSFVFTTGMASAAITQTCQNGGGNSPQGNCNGNGLTTENVNPSGHAPPGQNP
jgi:hypothetical protein